MWIDTHCHLDFPTFTDSPEVLIRRALEAQVTRFINIGCDFQSSFRGLELAQVHDFVFCTIGLHPNDADQWTPALRTQFLNLIREHATDVPRRIVGIGEIGLDYFRQGVSREIQQHVFREQLEFALMVEFPVVIHCRAAFEDTLSILEEMQLPAVAFHCFSGDLAVAERIWAHPGWITSFTAVVSYPKNEALREVVKQCSKDRYFLETDAPFLSHQSIRSQKNEPAHIPLLGQTIATLRGESLNTIAVDSSRNAERFFGL